MILEGKSICFLGDSITEGHSVEDIPNNRFDNVLKRLCGLKAVYNYGVGGTRIAHQFQPSETPRWDLNFCARARDMEKSADIIVVYGGVNDYFHGDAPFGQMGDTTRGTFCGAVDSLIRLLKETYPQAQLVFLTPAHCKGDANPSTSTFKHILGLPLKEYVDVITKTAESYGIPVLNMFEKLGIDPNDPEECARYTAEGLHFNDAGHAIIASTLKQFLETV